MDQCANGLIYVGMMSYEQFSLSRIMNHGQREGPTRPDVVHNQQNMKKHFNYKNTPYVINGIYNSA